MTEERRFNVLVPSWDMAPRPYGYPQDTPRSVPWALVAPREGRAKKNHGGQNLERLHDRGGLSPEELWALVHDKPAHMVFAISRADAVAWLKTVA